ncbi:MAG: divergent PAP2 family protein [Bullifex sp.]|nr:divergent PAP2 family protein [Bullifex sp.]
MNKLLFLNNDIMHNAPLISAFVACIAAQVLKPFIAVIMGYKFDRHMFVTTGGMPSSHSATVTALTASIAITQGVGSVAFAVSLVFAFIVMHDAMGIRQEAGKQAEVINEWSKILSDIHEDGVFSQEHLKTMLGHSFSQVVAGLVFGLLVGIGCTYLII